MTIFITESERKKMSQVVERAEMYTAFFYHPDHDKIREERKETRKFAIIKFMGKEKVTYVDTETMKAYKSDGYKKTWIEIKPFTFLRWARFPDL